MRSRIATAALLLWVSACGADKSKEGPQDGDTPADSGGGLGPDGARADADIVADAQSAVDAPAPGDADADADANTDAAADATTARDADAVDATLDVTLDASLATDADSVDEDAPSEGGSGSDASASSVDAATSDGSDGAAPDASAGTDANDGSTTDSSTADASGAACTAVPACAAVTWTEVLGSAGDATISSCGLLLQTTDTVRVLEGTQVAPWGIDGDFTVVVDFRDFAPNQVGGGFADAALVMENNDAILSGIITNDSTGGTASGFVIASVEPIGQVSPTDDTVATADQSGTMTFTRIGTVGTVTVSSSGATAVESGIIGANRIYPFFQAVSGNGTVSITFRSIQLTAGSGTFQSDAFTCNGL